jgi:hypothetical protein
VKGKRGKREKKKKNKGKEKKRKNILKYIPHQNIPPLHHLLPLLTIPPRPRSALASHPFQGHGPLCPSCPRESLCTALPALPSLSVVSQPVPVSRCTTSGEENPFAPQTSLLATRNASFSGCYCCYSRRRSTRHPHTIQYNTIQGRARQDNPVQQYNTITSVRFSALLSLSFIHSRNSSSTLMTFTRADRRSRTPEITRCSLME